MRHHRALLSLRDPALKTELAVEAAEQGWTSDQLAEHVAAHRPPVTSGRKPLPVLVKGSHGLERAVDALPKATAASIQALSPAQRTEVRQAVERAQARLAALQKLLA